MGRTTLSKVSKYGVFLVRILFYFFSSNTGKYGPEKTPYLDKFHSVNHQVFFKKLLGHEHFSYVDHSAMFLEKFESLIHVP